MPSKNESPQLAQNWSSLVPPLWLMILLGGFAGGFAGLGGFTFHYAQGHSYLSDNPAACVNCHIMREVFEGWNHGSHKAVAACNDCHTPNGFFGHWVMKGINGWKHSRAFTLGGFPEPIRITALDASIARNNCLRCHGEMTSWMDGRNSPDPTDCLRCHAGAGHGD